MTCGDEDAAPIAETKRCSVKSVCRARANAMREMRARETRCAELLDRIREVDRDILDAAAARRFVHVIVATEIATRRIARRRLRTRTAAGCRLFRGGAAAEIFAT